MKSMALYMGEIASYPRLSQQEEVALAEKVQAGDEEAKERFITSNLRLVFLVAKSYKNRGLDFEDLVMEGNLGLIKAVEKFDPSRGFRFSTYAFAWIRQTMGRAIDNSVSIVRIPVHVQNEIRKVLKAQGELKLVLKREPTHAEIAEAVEISEAEVSDLLASYSCPVSLDAKVKEDSKTTYADFLADSKPSIDENIEAMLRSESVQKAVSSLKENQAKVIVLRFGLDGQEPKTLEEIGAILGYTKENARQLEKTALDKLRKKLSKACPMVKVSAGK
jgi:RNA polymerase sigma factor (sigma-70 family)